MDKSIAKALLPKVGERRMEAMTSAKKVGFFEKAAEPCTVVQVHRAHLWYRVVFDNGFTECYKVPQTDAHLHRKRVNV